MAIYLGENKVDGGGNNGTSIPTIDEAAEFDANAKMNSTDMTSQEVDDFVDGLNVSGGGLNIITRSYSVSAKSATYYEETVSIGVSGYTPISVGWSANQINTNIYALYFVDSSTLFVGRSLTTGGQLSSNTVEFTVTYINV